MDNQNFNFASFPEFDNHKEVKFFSDKKSGLKAFVAIHNDNLGSATGGTRMWAYSSLDDAIRDALNLSRAMTYKCALSGVKFGGGKGVIIGDSKKDKNPILLKSYARSLKEYFGPKFSTGTDVGLTDEDVKLMKEENPFMVGVLTGNKLSTSKMASLGVFYSIQGSLEEITGSRETKGKSFAIKGLGKTGIELARLLREQGAEIVATELDKEKLEYVKEHFPEIKLVSENEIHKQEVDVYCPCALGGDLNETTIEELKCKFIVGVANNQLATEEMGDALWQKGIIYAPDYVINAGGLINVVDELEPGGYNKERVLARVAGLKETVKNILARAKTENQSPHRIADKIAQEIFLKK